MEDNEYKGFKWNTKERSLVEEYKKIRKGPEEVEGIEDLMDEYTVKMSQLLNSIYIKRTIHRLLRDVISEREDEQDDLERQYFSFVPTHKLDNLRLNYMKLNHFQLNRHPIGNLLIDTINSLVSQVEELFTDVKFINLLYRDTENQIEIETMLTKYPQSDIDYNFRMYQEKGEIIGKSQREAILPPAELMIQQEFAELLEEKKEIDRLWVAYWDHIENGKSVIVKDIFYTQVSELLKDMVSIHG